MTTADVVSFFGLLLLIGLIFDATRWLSITLLVLIGGGTAWYAYAKLRRSADTRAWQAQMEAERAAEFRRASATIEGSIAAIVAQHMPTLARKHRQLLQPDEYGVTNSSRWDKEVDRFVQAVLHPALTSGERQVFDHNTGSYRQRLRDQIEVGAAKFAAQQARQFRNCGSGDDLNPRDFEHWCAETLRDHGWAARPTPASGDQGADVVAEMHGHLVVIQCKLYSKPVGNKAVQEVHSARTFYGATAAAVVSNAGFTPSARTLARSTGVLLLDRTELPQLGMLVRRAS